MNDLIELNVYGSTCKMRLFADKLVVMQSDADYKRLVTLMVKNTCPVHFPDDEHKFALLRDALIERKKTVDGFTHYRMKQQDINHCQRQIARRIKATEDIMEKNGLTELWRDAA